MHNLDATVFVYRHKETKDIRCEYREVDGNLYDHIATLEPRMYIQYHYDDKEKFALLCEQMGIEGYGTLAIAAAIRL
tara:strand:- start:1522 stop:1752 length:231 start_codon:yes stop_codon:yes gene_type:complete